MTVHLNMILWNGILLMECIEKEFPWADEINLDTPCWNERTNAFYK